MNHITTKGTPVNPTEHTAKTPPQKTGLFATLRGPLRDDGSGAPAADPRHASLAPVFTWARSNMLLATPLMTLAALFAALAFTTAPAFAAAPEKPNVEPPAELKATTALLQGVLEPNQEEGTFEMGVYEFVYRQSPTECEGAGEIKTSRGLSLGSPKEPVSQAIENLEAGTAYTVCLLEHNEADTETATSAPATFTTRIPPETPETLEAQEVTGTTATLHGVLNPLKEGEAGTYEFLYRQSASECQGEGEKATSAEPALASSPQPVDAKVSGLLPGSSYTFCLLARNAAGEIALGPPDTFTTLATAPAVVSESASNVEATSATLQAQIDPDGSSTTYHFEYDTAPYETSAPHGTSTPELSIGSATGAVPVSVPLRGFVPGVTYYYRVVAINELASVDGPGKSFTTPTPGTETTGGCPNEQLRAEQPYGRQLPDCRAYEMVSPSEKNDSNAVAVAGGARVSTSGEAITYSSFGSFAEPHGTEYRGQYLSRRGPDGWSTTGISPPYVAYQVHAEGPFESLTFTPDLSKGLASTTAQLTDEVPAGFENLYVANFLDGTYEWATKGTPENEPYNFRNELNIGGASTDLSHVVYENNGSGVFEEWANGQSSPVGIAPNGQPKFAVLGYEQDVWHAVSADGSRVFMTSPVNAGEPNRQLYVRENPDQTQSPLNGEGTCIVAADACTVDVSASQRVNGKGEPQPDPNGPHPAWFKTASVDGSKVFFTSREELTDDANTGPADNAANLYEYDLESKRLTDLTVDTNPGDTNGAAVLGVADVSEDGSYVYFVAEGQLAAGAVSGEANLYAYHLGDIALIATLGREDEHDGFSFNPEGLNLTPPNRERVRVTPDGSRLAFQSSRSLTGYDNTDANTGQPDAEIFSYDVGSHRLVCVSCNPSGARPIGSSDFGYEKLNGGQTGLSYEPRSFSEDGSRLFFQSKDALVVHDGNGRQDVYEYEGGHVYPITNVAGNYASSFLDASPDGSDVFISTTDQLIPQDRDSLEDVYDVRVAGGFPVAVSPSACDNGDACKPPASAQPSSLGAPASATLSGIGNASPVPPPPPPKGRTAAQIRAEHLAKALKACRKKHNARKRAACTKQARKRYGPAKNASRSGGVARATNNRRAG